MTFLSRALHNVYADLECVAAHVCLACLAAETHTVEHHFNYCPFSGSQMTIFLIRKIPA